MKTTLHDRTERNAADANASRPAGTRLLHPPKSIEHRHERRKIREQLRRLNWFAGGETEFFA